MTAQRDDDRGARHAATLSPAGDDRGARGDDRAAAAPRNALLRALPRDELARLAPHLTSVEVGSLEVLAEAGAPLTHVYFPETAVISLVRRLRDGTSVEAGVVGREGMVELAVLLGDAWSPVTLMGQMPGTCLRAPFEPLRAALPALPTLADRLRRFALALMDQMGQNIACIGRHSVEQRLARWLLTADDQVGGEMALTHGVLAQMLGVRRAGVTVAALALQRTGLIAYSRGHVVVRDRARLEAAACECHGVVRATHERLLGAVQAAR